MGRESQVRLLRSSPSGETREWSAGVVPVLSAGLFAAFLWLALFVEPSQRRPVSSVVAAVVMAVLTAVTTSLVRLPNLGTAERRAWRTLLAAFAMFLVGTLLGLVALFRPEALPDGVTPFRQILLVTAFGAMVLALFRLPAAPVHGLAKARFVLDTVTIFASSTIFLWHFVIAPRLRTQGISGGDAVVLVVVVGFMAVFVGALAMLLLRERTPGTREALIRLVMGVAVVFGVIIVSISRGGTQGGTPPLWSTALTWFAYVLVVSAAVQQRRHALGEESVDREVEHRILLALPYVAVALAFGFLLLVGVREAPMELRGVLISASAVGVCVLVRQRLLLKENELLRGRLEQQASHDDLTGLRNRRSWQAEAERELAKARREGRPVSLLVLDLDKFKSVNDQCGHAAGDVVLRAVGEALRDGVRGGDLPGRMGGDEFMVLLPDTELADATHVAKALCARLGRLQVAEAGGVDFTVSVGVASLPPAASLRELVAVADAAMYTAKREGRNRVQTGGAMLSVVGPRRAGEPGEATAGA